MFRSLIADNRAIFDGGGIRNEGNALVEHNTITHNQSDSGGGNCEHRIARCKDSAINFNSTTVLGQVENAGIGAAMGRVATGCDGKNSEVYFRLSGAKD